VRSDDVANDLYLNVVVWDDGNDSDRDEDEFKLVCIEVQGCDTVSGWWFGNI